ncbi:MAG: hypothetical protein K2K32_03270 [Muribaculaceae bacterium]|nr:hypothetical protein [Muribaculaceae bacterium]
MRIQTLILCLLFCVASSFAKDVITKTDGTKLDAKVEEITETVIKYRKVSNPTGPVYTIPIASVASVLYENGDVDTFNTEVVMPDVPTVKKTSPSDEELISIAESQSVPNQSGYVSDTELFKIASSLGRSSNDLMDQANKYRKISWIGAGTILVVGICGTTLLFGGMWGFEDSDITSFILPVAAGCSAGAAAIWALGFNMKANSLMKQAREMQSYSATLIENEIIRIGDNSLTAGINLMGNRMVNSHTLGLSLGLNF